MGGEQLCWMALVDVSIHCNVDPIPYSDNSECGDIGEKVQKPLELEITKVSHRASDQMEV